MSFKLLLAIPALCLIAGCNTVNKNIGQDDPAIGEAVRYNAAVQTVNPEPVYAADSALPGEDGQRGAAAVKRYRSGQVKEVESQGTSSGGAGSSCICWSGRLRGSASSTSSCNRRNCSLR